MKSGHRNRKIALASAVVVALLLLCACHKSTGENLSAEEVQQRACEYLASQYSAEFTILRCDTKSDSPGPIPVGKTHWELMVKSDRFPEDSFLVYYRTEKDDSGEWYWTDNYYSLLFRDEANSAIKASAEQFFSVDCLIESLWGINVWPENIGENSTFKEWLNAGGKCPTFIIYLKETAPEEAYCQKFADSLLAEFPTIKFISFYGMTADAFDEVPTNGGVLTSLWNDHPEWRIGQISCNCKNLEME